MTRSICFLTCGIDHGPVGGYKVVYEYANRFVAAGWNVAIAYPFCSPGNRFPKYFWESPFHAVNLFRSYVVWKLKTMLGRLRGGAWFPLDRRVRKIYPLQYSRRFPRRFPRGTKFIATYITTVRDLNRFMVPTSDKVNLIQGFEAWFGVTPEEVLETYRFPMQRVAISEWLCEKVREAGTTAVKISNGLDFEYFRNNRTEGEAGVSSATKVEIAMLWHGDTLKRTEDALEALRLVKVEHPEIHVTAFGVPDTPPNLPDWFTYVQKPDRDRHNRIYNEADIFVASSEQEGWGLTPCEAMICGAAVCCTDIGGYREFAKDGETALMSPPRDPKALAANICRLIADPALRARIAKAGSEKVREFSWERSFEMMKRLLTTAEEL